MYTSPRKPDVEVCHTFHKRRYWRRLYTSITDNSTILNFVSCRKFVRSHSCLRHSCEPANFRHSPAFSICITTLLRRVHTISQIDWTAIKRKVERCRTLIFIAVQSNFTTVQSIWLIVWTRPYSCGVSRFAFRCTRTRAENFTHWALIFSTWLKAHAVFFNSARLRHARHSLSTHYVTAGN
jgi:hypothetical protein